MSPGPAQRLDRQAPSPLWAQLEADLTRRVQSGEFDSAFPGEHRLMSDYDISRHTVREALRRLRDAGLIDASRGRGTWVRRTAIEQPLGSLYSLYREIQSRGMVSTSRVIAQAMTRDAAVAPSLGMDEDALLFYLERVRFADGSPLAHDRIWLPADIGEPLMDADFSTGALYDELAARCGVRLTGGHERITGIVPDRRERALLSVPQDVACLEVHRSGVLRERVVEHRHAVVRADMFSVIAQWSPRGYTVGASAGPLDA
jgi:GntR family transcriptional regulator